MSNKAEFILSAKDMSGSAFSSMNRNLNDLDRQSLNTSSSLSKLDLGFASLGSSIAAGAAAIAAAIPMMSQYGREISLSAQMANMGTDEFQQWAYATDTVGIRMDKLADISKDVTDKLGDYIATGGGEFADFFEKVAPLVGVTADELARLSGPEALQAIKNAMDDANVSASEQVFYFEAIANDASLLIPILADNGREVRKLQAEFDELNLAVTEEELEKLNRMASDLSRVWTAAKNTAAVAVSAQEEELEGFADKAVASFSAASQSFRAWQDLAEEDSFIGRMWDIAANGLLDSRVMKEYGEQVGLDAKEAGETAAFEFNAGFLAKALNPSINIPTGGDDVQVPYAPKVGPAPLSDQELKEQQQLLAQLEASMDRAALMGLDATQRIVVGYDQQMQKLDEYAAEHPLLIAKINEARDEITQHYYAALEAEAKKRQESQQDELESYRRTHMSQTELLQVALDERVAKLDEFRANDLINEVEYTNEKLKAEQDYNDALAKLQEKRVEDNRSYLEQMRDELKKSTDGFDAVWDQSLDRLASGFGEVAQTAVFDSDNIGDAFAGMFEGMARSMVGFFAEWAAQRMLLWVLEQTLGKATATGYVAQVAGQGAAQTQLWAINAASSVAAIPYVGAFMAPGAALAAEAAGGAMTAAATAAAASSLVGMAHDGIDRVPQEGTWLLNTNERVLNQQSADQMDSIAQYVQQQILLPPPAQSIVQPQISSGDNVTIQALDSKSFNEFASRNNRTFAKQTARARRNQAKKPL
ncbi:hypothetical protein [Ferrimonas aestuarii]|uniref:Uncharacterized protein n=1 Tax=Ferrimonas aestuarii TaxID=2569539 RepID=A0A4U1BLX4_9GAMM|nr:hypothetical protein [Ferrimonas aestuarii]TKB53307.1 hypothetical protein FCL42_14655 [Ferrimonas aestuarii]